MGFCFSFLFSVSHASTGDVDTPTSCRTLISVVFRRRNLLDTQLLVYSCPCLRVCSRCSYCPFSTCFLMSSLFTIRLRTVLLLSLFWIDNMYSIDVYSVLSARVIPLILSLSTTPISYGSNLGQAISRLSTARFLPVTELSFPTSNFDNR